MPVPKPKPKEDRQSFISRCISKMHDLDPNRPQKQLIAICFSSWRKNRYSETEVKDIIKWYEAMVGNLPIVCVCPKCGATVKNPKSHCPEIKCPKCGTPMRRRMPGAGGRGVGGPDVEESLTKTDANAVIPRWVSMARKLMKSKKANAKLKEYWRLRLEKWEKTHGGS